jgi:ABC-type multidrug transport system fused ATPase/permease subunit
MEVIDDSLPWAFDDVIMFTVSVASTMIIVSTTTPMFLAALPVLSILVLVIQQYYLCASRAIKRIFHVSKSPIYQHFNESLGGVSTIRAMQLQDRFILENAARVDAHTNYHVAYLYCIRWVEVRLQCLSAVVIFIVAITFVINRSTVDPSTAGLAMSFVLTITQDVNYLVRVYCELQNRLVPVERVCEYIDLPTEAPELLPMSEVVKEKWPPRHGKIVFDNYSTRYREGLDLVLKNISFEVQPGESVGIVGRTGAGKSSLALALFRMIEAANSPWCISPDGSGSRLAESDSNNEPGGKIEIDGVDISTLGLVDLRQALAIIPQDPILFAGSVRDNLDPFQEHSDHALWQALERAHLKEHIQSVPGGLSFEVAQHGENFSMGQRSLICLARALLRKTKILILDEATSAVDVETDELIQETIRTEFKNRTILTIAHRIKTVMDSDKILVLEQGQVVEFDRPEELLKRKDESLFYRLAEQAGEV